MREAPEGGGGLYSTVGDFARFAQMLCNGGELEGHRILKPETVAMMNVDQVPTGGPSYGLGVGIETDADAEKTRGSVGSYGWSGSGQVHFWVDPKEQIVGIFLTQTLPYTIDRDTEMRTIVYGALKD
jgi:CubicO group peptidase (beta-lactamase class C family)